MSQKTYMYDTQWTALINAINGGDTSAIATALGQIKTSVDEITTALGSLSADVTQDATQWSDLITAIGSGGGGGGGTVDIDATQWANLLTSIDKGDTSALATALGLIKSSVDAINASLGSLSVGVSQNATQWNNLVNAITNQSLTVDLSNVTSTIVTNLSRITGVTVSDALNNILMYFNNYIKIKSFNVTAANLSTNMDLSSYVSLDAGYRFLGYQTLGCANNFVPTFPIYISQPSLTQGRPWWNGSIPSSGSVLFYYFEIRDL